MSKKRGPNDKAKTSIQFPSTSLTKTVSCIFALKLLSDSFNKNCLIRIFSMRAVTPEAKRFPCTLHVDNLRGMIETLVRV